MPAVRENPKASPEKGCKSVVNGVKNCRKEAKKSPSMPPMSPRRSDSIKKVSKWLSGEAPRQKESQQAVAQMVPALKKHCCYFCPSINSGGDAGLHGTLSHKDIRMTWAVAPYLGLGQQTLVNKLKPRLKPKIWGHVAA
jgi:hypothetical protein